MTIAVENLIDEGRQHVDEEVETLVIGAGPVSLQLGLPENLCIIPFYVISLERRSSPHVIRPDLAQRRG